jgi:Mrp family chromosome partitioning ATPase
VSRKPTIPLVDSNSPAVVAFRGLRVSVDFASDRRRGRAVMFTSTSRGEGTSMVALNHAALTAASGRDTLLIDANLARPVLHEWLGQGRGPGVADVLATEATLEQAIEQVELDGTTIDFLPAGTPVRGSGDLLSSRAAADLIEAACSNYHAVVLDVPPALGPPDAAAVGAMDDVDTVVIVRRNQRQQLLMHSVTRLQRTGSNVLGIVLNAG